MLRLLAWLGLIVFLALPQRTMVKMLRGAKNVAARATPSPADPGAPLQRSTPEPIEVDDESADADAGGEALNVSAALAAQLAPVEPRYAVAMPSATRAGVLWSLAVQECGPPRA